MKLRSSRPAPSASGTQGRSYKDASGSEDEEEDDEQPHSAPMVIDLTKIEAVQSIDLTDDE